MRSPPALIAIALVVTLQAAPSAAAILYKSVSPNGTVSFSDLPPEGVRKVETVRIPDASTAGNPATEKAIAATQSAVDVEAALARANGQLDLAEHALAQARRSVWSETEGLTLHGLRMSRTDQERVEFFKRNVVAARLALMELLKQSREMVAVHEPGAPYSPALASVAR